MATSEDVHPLHHRRARPGTTRSHRSQLLGRLLITAAALLTGLLAWAPAPAGAASAGTITTVAGGPGPGTAFGTAFAADDLEVIGSKIYLADHASNVIRAFDRSTKTFTVVAGKVSDGAAVPGPATATPLPGVRRIAARGTSLLVGAGSQILQIDAGGTVSVFAGTGQYGFSGDGGPATAAKLSSVDGIAVRADGSVYFSDGNQSRIRKIATNGVITTVAGTGTSGFTGDNGPATSAQLAGPGAMTFDSNGNLYFGDDFRVRRIATNGVITTVAGNGTSGTSGDNGPAVNAALLVYDLAVDPANNVLVATGVYGAVRKVVPGGNITTVAGNNGYGHTGDGGPAVDAKFATVRSVVSDPAGGYIVGDSAGPAMENWLRPVSAAGIVTSIAGGKDVSVSGDGGPASAAQMGPPQGMARDNAGNVYVVDKENSRVRKISAAGVITAFAGTGRYGMSGDGGPATQAQLWDPVGVAVDSAANVYVSDSQNANVRKITAAGIISTVAGVGTQGFSGDGGPAKGAKLQRPEGLAVDKAGNLYIADAQNNRVRQVATNGTISTIAGTGVPGFSGDGAEANTAQLASPRGVAIDGKGRLLIADSSNRRIRRVANGTITTVAGSGVSGSTGDGGPALQATFTQPVDVAVDQDGAMFVTDAASNRIRKVSGAGTVTTVAGSSATDTFGGDGGPAAAASLNTPRSTVAKPNGDLLIADAGNHRLRQVSSVTATSVRFHSVAPYRVLDSRTAVGGFNGPVAAGAANVKTLTVGGAGGVVPTTATAVVMNVTATQGTAGSFLTVYPAGGGVPTASNLNFGAGETIPNLVTVKLSPDGKVTFFNAVGSVHVVADIVGYFDSGIEADGQAFTGVPPARILDSHGALGGFNGPIAPGTSKDLTVTNVAGVPATATTVVLTITATDGTANSFLTVYPAGGSVPTSSTVNFAKGQTISNLVTAKVGAGGKISIFNQLGSAHVLADVVGYYAPNAQLAAGRFHPFAPVRILDDRNGTGGYATAWGPGTSRSVAVAGVFGIPSAATGVVVNITATNGTAASRLTVSPDGLAVPGTATVHFVAGETIPDLTMVKLGPTGKMTITNNTGSVDVVADVVGYYTDL